ncbi:glucosaminidase domain-containing protein [Paenibacillus sp. p3-SID867]|uniref:glucosaminidase domain-containing protein n=1 Tax=Paenibacillus sp. p3-SID867 TaxID=2916363 RepID=UPI0021A67A2B|nr:glucosaminidase domain-containing protein [Paenibacillus sp. p3-SID867]MCT1401485.1 glucosaminidase domain-containing protein [Paenibacillus sp. p3-SID867]
MKPSEFIAKLAPIATQDMRQYGVPASLTLAQAILESNWGMSGLTQKANNLFGIKGTGPAGSVTMQTTEYRGQTPYTTQAQFRKYNSWSESVADHTRLILNGTRDKPQRYHGVLWANYKTAATEIWRGGYATDPNYPKKLIALMEQNLLHQYDLLNPEEEERMKIEQLTAELQKTQEQMQQLSKQYASAMKLLEEQSNTMKQLNTRLKAVETEKPAKVPAWAEPAVQAAQQAEVLHDPEGSFDFYRIMTVLHRLGFFDRPSK